MDLRPITNPYLQALLQHLEAVYRRPGMYIGPVDRHTLNAYLNGLYMGLEIGGLALDQSLFVQIAQQRGWQTETSMGYWPDMDAKGLSEIEIITEELRIHIEMWKSQIH